MTGMTDDGIDDLCSNIRKPGGLIPNPVHVEDPTQPPSIITDPGIAIRRIFQERLKQIAYFYLYLNLINRNFVAARAGVEELVRLWKYRKNLENIMESKKQDKAR